MRRPNGSENNSIEKDQGGSGLPLSHESPAPRRAPSSSDSLSGKGRILFFPSKRNDGGDDPTDPTPFVAGASPAAHRLEAKRGLVLYQFVDTDGDTRVVARRHGVTESDVKRVVARMLKPVVSKILREAA